MGSTRPAGGTHGTRRGAGSGARRGGGEGEAARPGREASRAEGRGDAFCGVTMNPDTGTGFTAGDIWMDIDELAHTGPHSAVAVYTLRGGERGAQRAAEMRF